MTRNQKLLTIAFVGIIAAITNPNLETHRESVKSKLFESSQDLMNDSDNEWVKIGSVFGTMLGGAVIENLVSTDNFVFFSITKVRWQGETRRIGIGAFGNVFLFKEPSYGVNDTPEFPADPKRQFELAKQAFESGRFEDFKSLYYQIDKAHLSNEDSSTLEMLKRYADMR